jgi:deferrochelatase/peroxidase EfeB
MSHADILSKEAKTDIQGFITSGFGHLHYTAYLFIEIRDQASGQAWLQSLLPQITSAASWRFAPDSPKAKPERALNIAFTFAGLTALGLSGSALRSFPSEFRAGMASSDRARVIGDTHENAPDRWEIGGPGNPPIHSLLILHATTRADLDAWSAALRTDWQRWSNRVIEHQASAQIGERPPYDREPFGFFDSIGQPKILGIKGEGICTGEFILGYRNEYNYHPASPVVPVASDPQHILPRSANPYRQSNYHDLGFNGTFLVYRKLQQDVAGFWRFLQNESLRHKGEVDPQFMVWLAAKMIGRWPSGTPLVLSPKRDQPEAILRNDFLYAEDDPVGLACPFGAHIRRTNPRDQIRPAGPAESAHMTARHRLLRRGRAFGRPLFDARVLDTPDHPEARDAIVNMQDDGEPRGIHFVCINASIKSQFEFVQQAWMNNPRFNGLVNNRDPLSSESDPSAAPSIMRVPARPTGLHTAPMPRFVTMRGGAYFFMPSLTALRYLSAGMVSDHDSLNE